MRIEPKENVEDVLTVTLLTLLQLCLEDALRFGHGLVQARLLLDLLYFLFLDSEPMLHTR